MGDTFKIGNNEYKYSDVVKYDFKYDVNGNPRYTVMFINGSKKSISGSQAYEFDPTRVMMDATIKAMSYCDNIYLARGGRYR